VWEYRVGHVIDELRKLPDNYIQCVITSPPYWGLRKYSGEQQIIWGGDQDCEQDWKESPPPQTHKAGNIEPSGLQKTRKRYSDGGSIQFKGHDN
jgi:DNA modification methylase